MRRRDIVLGAAAAVVVDWRAAAEETPKSAHIGFIVTGERFPRRDFDEAMRRLGWVEGRNLVVERRVTGEDPERRKTAAAELIAANPDVIVAAGLIDALPVYAQTRTLPIVVISGRDIVEAGLADSLAHPGGNVTGVINLGGELDGNRIELLHELVPAATRISVLVYARLPRSAARVTAIEALARPLGLRVTKRPVSEAREIDGAFRRQCSRPGPGNSGGSECPNRRESVPGARACSAIPLACGLRAARVCRGWRFVVLRTAVPREFRARCRARRQDPEGRQTRRSAGRATDPV